MLAASALTKVAAEVRLRDELISRLTHEARTPVSAILTWLEVLKSEAAIPPQAVRAIAMAQRSTRELTEILSGAEDAQQVMAGTIELQMTPLDLAGLVRSVVDRVLPAAQARSITLDCETANPGRPTQGDEARLRHSFTRILAHCVGLSGPGPMQVRLLDQGTDVRVEVLGLALTLSDSLREALQDDGEWPSIAGPRGQAVLDFAVACRIVALHGGRLEAESMNGRGMRVCATLPTPPASAG